MSSNAGTLPTSYPVNGFSLQRILYMLGIDFPYRSPAPTVIGMAVVTPLLHYRLGAGAAGFLLLSGMSCPAERALRLGLVHELAVSGELASAEQELAASILKGAPGALSATKAHLLDCAAGLREQLEYAARLSAEARDTDEAREGLAAFLEKRRPNWH